MTLQLTMPNPLLGEAQAALPTVVVVGGANMDLAASSNAPLVAHDSNVGTIRCAPGGVARNVAENLARLDRRVHLVSLVGDDAFGQSVKDLTQRSGVDVSGVLCIKGCRTSTYLSLHGPDGDMAVAVNDMGILEQLGPDMLAQSGALIVGAAALVLDANLPVAGIAWLIRQATPMHCFVDGVSAVKCTKVLPYLSQIQTLKLNALEAHTLTGMEVSHPDEGRAAALHLHKRGAQRVVVSLGAKGVVWCDADATTGHLSSNEVVVASTSGAGDALLAGIVHGTLAGWSLPASVQFGQRCAEFTLSSPYSNHPDLSVNALLAG
jgi:pseudouridine kinase